MTGLHALFLVLSAIPGRVGAFCSKAANATGVVAQDAQKAIGLIRGAQAAKAQASVTISSGLVWLVALLCLSSCSAPMHAKDPTIESTLTKACELLGDQRRAAIDAEAKRAGISLDTAEKAFKAACAARMVFGVDDAARAGLAGVAAPADAGAP